MINPSTTEVLLIKKNRPEFQKGKWNGIGGKVEVGETPIDAMVREFWEETGHCTPEALWERTITLDTPTDTVHFYRAVVDSFHSAIHTKTDEEVAVHKYTDLYIIPMLKNAQWILPLQFNFNIRFPLRIVYQDGN